MTNLYSPIPPCTPPNFRRLAYAIFLGLAAPGTGLGLVSNADEGILFLPSVRAFFHQPKTQPGAAPS